MGYKPTKGIWRILSIILDSTTGVFLLTLVCYILTAVAMLLAVKLISLI